MTVVGGRAVHPVNVRVGGFYKAPDRATVRALADPLRRALEASLETVKWVSGFDFPDVEGDYLFVALRAERPLPDRGGPGGLFDRARLYADRVRRGGGGRARGAFDGLALPPLRALALPDGTAGPLRPQRGRSEPVGQERRRRGGPRPGVP